MAWGAIAAAAAELGSTAWQSHHARSAASKSREFAREMASTQYQRAVKDMRKAGINPMLAAKVGGNAVPPTPMAGGISPGNPVNAAFQAKTAAQNLDNMRSQEKFTDAQAYKAGQEGRLAKVEADKQEVTKGIYEAALPFMEDLKQFIHSAREAKDRLGTKEGSGGFIENLLKSIGGEDVGGRYLTPEEKRERDKYRNTGPKKGKYGSGKNNRLKPIEVGPND